ncbi:MAG: PAS domain S-box protein [Pseudomonadaceae bacterium]|nr:PAS domain S-box protein [Pseudomonadaceae bacterium]
MRSANQRQAHEVLARETQRMADAVEKRIELYQYGLRGVRGAVLASGERGISRERFLNYSKTRDIDSEFPGARGFGFIRRVAAEDEARFLARARADGMPDFQLRQLSPHGGDRFVIQYIEPMWRNAAALGLDLASEGNRRSAALAALHSGEVHITGPITLVQATGNPLQSFLILMPIYRGAVTPDSVEERMAKGFGWSFAPLITEDVLRGLQHEKDALHLRLRDITEQGKEVDFYESAALRDDLLPGMTKTAERKIFGRLWQIELSAHPAFVAQLHQTSPRLVAFLGILGSLLLAALVQLYVTGQRRQREVLAEQARSAAIVESSNDGIIGQTLDGVVTSWNRGAENIFGYRAEEAVGRTLLELTVPQELADEERHLLRLIALGEPVDNFDTRRRHKDGRLVDVSASVSPIYDSSGSVVGVSKTVRDISAQKAAEQRILELNASLEEQVGERTRELRELNVLLNNVMQSASEVSIIATDLDGVIRVFNRGAERLLGYSAAEMVGLQSPAVIHLAEEVQARAAELSRVYGQPIEGFRTFVHKPELEGSETREWTYVRKDGERFPVTLVVTAMRDGQGQLVGYLGIALDITQRKAAEQQLADSLETTRAVLDTAVTPVITFDAQGNVRSFNPAAQRAFGYSFEEMSGHSVFELIAADSQQPMRTLIEQHIERPATPAAKDIEIWGLCRDGEEFPCQLSIGSMHTSDELTLVAVITDLTQQVRLRREALAVRDQLLLAAEVADLGIWSWTPADNSLQWNERMHALYDQPRELLEGGLTFEHWRARLHPEDAPVIEAWLQDALAGRTAFDPVFRVVWRDGQIRYIQAGAQVERDDEGQALKVTGINRDITAQLQLESRLRHAKEQADAASAAKSAFLANMSHEIRTPMNAVLGMLQLVQGTGLNPRQLDYVQKAHGAAQSLLGLLNDILDYSKIEAGKLQLDAHDFELEPLMRDLAVVLSGNLGSKDIEVMFDVDARLPSVLHGDSLRLQQVLINLAGNALKFTSQGQVVVSLRQLQRSAERVTLRLAVSDTGIGISEKQLLHIFDGFTQAEASTSRRYGGSGLGLVICKRLVNMMGGELRVESRLGEGSRFWCDLELGVAADASLAMAAPDELAGLRLLIVDDNPVARQLLQQTALELGWQADCVSGGLQALEQLRSRSEAYDVVLMDWRMPEMDGLEAALLIREQAGDALAPVVIMITAHGREVLAERYSGGGVPFEAFLTKPVTPQQLVACVQRTRHPGSAEVVAPAYQSKLRLLGLRLLVVEDNPLNRQVARELLAGEGAEVSLAEGGQEGVDMALSGQPFDAVLMDIQMPDMDGLEATRRIRRQRPHGELPIIAMTANASQADREDCLAAGMDDHVGKPVDIEKLVTVLLHWAGAAVVTEAAEVAGAESADSVLKRFGGNLQLLRSVLASFPQEMGKQLDQLAAHRASGNQAAILSALHTLKGSAGTMGAQGLSQRAAELEQQFRQTPDAALSDDAWLADLRRRLEQGCRELQAMFAAPEVPVAQGLDGDTASWVAALCTVRPLLESGNLSALDRLQELAGAVPAQLGGAFEALQQAADLLDFERALILLQELLDGLGGD